MTTQLLAILFLGSHYNQKDSNPVTLILGIKCLKFKELLTETFGKISIFINKYFGRDHIAIVWEHRN